MTLLILGFLSLSSFDSYAQDKNLLAKVAYENAEAAFAEESYREADTELDKVDELLGKVTPKSLYLRVQVLAKAAEKDDRKINSALEACRRYFTLSKQASIPEDKLMEVARLLLKLEKDKEAYDKKKEAIESCAALKQQLLKALSLRDESKIMLLSPFDFSRDLSEALKLSGSYSGREQNQILKNLKKEDLTYTNKFSRYNTDVYSSNLSGSKWYIHKNLGFNTKGDYIITTDKKNLIQVGIDIEANGLEPIIQKISSLIGFEPDKRNKDAEGSDAYWLFENYTVVIKLVRSANNVLRGHLVIVKHFPETAKLLGASPKTSCTAP